MSRQPLSQGVVTKQQGTRTVFESARAGRHAGKHVSSMSKGVDRWRFLPEESLKWLATAAMTLEVTTAPYLSVWSCLPRALSITAQCLICPCQPSRMSRAARATPCCYVRPHKRMDVKCSRCALMTCRLVVRSSKNYTSVLTYCLECRPLSQPG
jgi:hypothetical protein